MQQIFCFVEGTCVRCQNKTSVQKIPNCEHHICRVCCDEQFKNKNRNLCPECKKDILPVLANNIRDSIANQLAGQEVSDKQKQCLNNFSESLISVLESFRSTDLLSGTENKTSSCSSGCSKDTLTDPVGSEKKCSIEGCYCYDISNEGLSSSDSSESESESESEDVEFSLDDESESDS